jgi:hypothetical protein
MALQIPDDFGAVVAEGPKTADGIDDIMVRVIDGARVIPSQSFTPS